MRCSQLRDAPPGGEELGIRKERQRIETISRHTGEHRRKFIEIGNGKQAELQSKQRGDRLDVIPEEGVQRIFGINEHRNAPYSSRHFLENFHPLVGELSAIHGDAGHVAPQDERGFSQGAVLLGRQWALGWWEWLWFAVSARALLAYQ